MTEHLSDESQRSYLTLTDLLSVAWKGKTFVVIITTFFTIITFIYSLSIEDFYDAEASFVESESNNSTTMNQSLTGLAGFAGLNLESDTSKAAVASNILMSKKFLSTFVVQREALYFLTGVKKEELALMEEPNRNKTILEGADALRSSFSFSRVPLKPVYKLIVTASTPELAMNWANWLIEDLNESIRQNDVLEAEKSIKFLEEKAMTTSVSDFKALFFSMIESHAKTVMLSEIRKEYVFKTIDPAVLPFNKSGPVRVKMVAWAVIIGIGTGTLLLLILDFFGLKISRFRIVKKGDH